jgi:transmembrane sensor
VTSGAVEVASPREKVMLDSGDVGIVTPAGAVSRSADVVTADDVAWTQGRLVFRNASMRELTADLRRWYGVELRVTDSTLGRKHFTGSFAGEPIERVMQVLALALRADAQRRGDMIVLSPRR